MKEKEVYAAFAQFNKVCDNIADELAYLRATHRHTRDYIDVITRKTEYKVEYHSCKIVLK